MLLYNMLQKKQTCNNLDWQHNIEVQMKKNKIKKVKWIENNTLWWWKYTIIPYNSKEYTTMPVTQKYEMIP